MRIAMIGGGYVGLVSGACFAAFGHEVAIVEADKAKLAALKARRMPIYEPGLAELVAEHDNRLLFMKLLPEAVAGAEAVFIAVGTPTRRGDGMPTCPMCSRPPSRWRRRDRARGDRDQVHLCRWHRAADRADCGGGAA